MAKGRLEDPRASLPPHLRYRRQWGARTVDAGYLALSEVARRLPAARPERHRVVVRRDLRYREGGDAAHGLDLYRPEGVEGPLPVVFYAHGGGFRALSKDTHWLMGLAYARQGYAVVNINYRLAPAWRYPAAHEDAAAALSWVVQNAGELQVDPSRLFLAGESAGANLVASLALGLSLPRPEPWLAPLKDLPARPLGILAYCGILQISDPERFLRKRALGWFVRDRLDEVQDLYLSGGEHPAELADPVLVAEALAARGERPSLPPFFLPVGTRDPLLDDTRRFARALALLGAEAEDRYYPGEIHAFHALIWREKARECWRDSFAFMARCQERMHLSRVG